MKLTVKLLSVMLIIAMLFSMVACGDTPEETKPEGTKAPEQSQPKETEPKETEPKETEPKETESETEPVETEPPIVIPPLPEAQTIPDGTMIFYEDFETVGNIMGADAVFEALRIADGGKWVWDSMNDPYYSKAGGYNRGYGSPAYGDPSDKMVVGVVDGRLAIYAHTDPDGNTVNATSDAYIILADEEQLWEAYQGNYTVQFDVEYVSGKDNKRYIALLLNYCGRYYTSFHFRLGGYANFQINYNGGWQTLDTAGEYAANGYDYKNGPSIANKLLGQTIPQGGEASEPRFANLPVTIRIQVTPGMMADGGMITVWMKRSSSDEFVKISQTSGGSSGASYLGTFEFDEDIACAGGALCLKIGSAINGYVDNIMMWTGHDDVPIDTTVTYTPSAVVEHRK